MNSSTTTFVWDRHTRLFHWSLVLLFCLSLGTGLNGDMDWMEWHIKFGYGLLGLMVFRILTGIFGRDYGHFSRFPLSIGSVKSYLAGQQTFHGHNPMGSWMVVVMLMAITTQIISGFLTTDDFFFEGPWVKWGNDSWVKLAGKIHDLNWIILAVLAGLHLLAIVFYQFWKKEKLVNAMVTGRKQEKVSENTTAAPIPLWGAGLLAVVAGGLTWGIILLPGWL
ncbi:hypothetical protein G8770_02965 [Aestuariicella hydrocarbonica]|uniref:Cytochrome b561 bacterial/Ni-hydrogenase domain-containing protein n=1 Tax=Pseudomaricurvus hydrocarbonicus TaxID=1470433 RepID=A0A9E5MGD4_9GAMM|nr:cytochrome b/b6 domain-containing protein [Aestuariicella hydrocarbonica]NHO64506.1 hypothetical protein [Aestuariicella hydrocarbonica]